MTTHNNDCEDCDIRIGIVPATKNKPDDVTPIHPCAFGFPRYVGYDRGSTYHPEALEKEKIPGEPLAVTKPLGHIPEVNYTYRYIDGTYGMMNEHGLSIGESTCGAKIVSYSVAQGGDALFDISALTRLALQRCKTSLCAIELMGSLAEKHGYYGSEDPVESGTDLFEVAGEALLIVDRETASGWVFHMLADPSGKSAIWAAQRIPDDHIAVVPNKFVIDRMNLSDTDNFRASAHIRKKAIEAGFLDKSQDAGDDAFEFSRAFALDYTNGTTSVGEQLNSAEGERRRWRVFSQLAPSRNFQPDQKERFPFSIKPDRPVSLAMIQSLMRDYYAGTQFDTSQGLAAGPWHNPNRYDRNTEQQPEVRDGFFERTINIHRTSYSFVAQVHPDQPNPGVLWLSHHSPVNSIYLPIYASTRSLPASFGTGSLFRFSRASAWWAFAAVSNNAERMFQPIHAVIAEEQKVVEEDNRNQIAKVNHQVNHMIKKGLHNQAVEVMTDFTVRRSEEIVSRWWLLNDELLGMFHDGVRLKSPRPPLELEHIFYPVDWLRQVGYFARGPLPPATYPTDIPQPNHRRGASQKTNNEATLEEANTAGKKIATEETPKPMVVMTNVESEPIPISLFANPNRTDDSVDSSDRVVSPTWYDAHAREFLIGGFSVIFLLLAIVFFLLGRWWGANHPNRSRYAEIPTVEDDQHPSATGGYDRYRRQHDIVDPGQRVVLTNR